MKMVPYNFEQHGFDCCHPSASTSVEVGEEQWALAVNSGTPNETRAMISELMAACTRVATLQHPTQLANKLGNIYNASCDIQRISVTKTGVIMITTFPLGDDFVYTLISTYLELMFKYGHRLVTEVQQLNAAYYRYPVIISVEQHAEDNGARIVYD